jgi:hypothetical protein
MSTEADDEGKARALFLMIGVLSCSAGVGLKYGEAAGLICIGAGLVLLVLTTRWWEPKP